MDSGGVDRLPLMDEQWKDVDEDSSDKRITRSFVRTQRERKHGKEMSSCDQLKDWTQNCLTTSFSVVFFSLNSIPILEKTHPRI